MVNKARGRTMNVRSGVATGDGDRSAFADRALAALHALALAAGGVADPAELAGLACVHARDLLDVRHATLLIWDETERALVVLASTRRVRTGFAGVRFQPGEGLSGAAFARNAPVVADAYGDGAEHLPWAVAAAGVASAAAVPLCAGSRAIGVLSVWTTTPHTFTDEELRFLTLLSTQVAPAIELARLAAENARGRQQAEARSAALAASEERLRTTLDAMACGVNVRAADGRLLYANEASRKILGDAQAEQGYTDAAAQRWDVLGEDGSPLSPAQSPHAAALRSGQPVRDALVGVCNGAGERRWLRASAVPYATGDGEAIAVVNSFLDVTEQQRAAEALRASEQRFRDLFEQSNDAIIVHDREGRVLDANSRACEMLGYGIERLRELRLQALQADLTDVELDTIFERLSLRRGVRGETRLRRADGRIIDVDVSARLLRDDAPQIIAIIRDVTARKQAEAELRRQHGYLEALHETTLGLLNRLEITDLLPALVNRAAMLLGVEHGFVNLLSADGETMAGTGGVGLFSGKTDGFQRGEGLVGAVWQAGATIAVADYALWAGRAPGGYRDVVRAAVAVPLRSAGEVVGVIGLARLEAGRAFTAAEVELLERFAQLASIAYDNARLYTAQQRDLEERIRAERALRAAEERYRGIFENAIEGIFRTRFDGHFHIVNPALARILGYRAPNELLAADPEIRGLYADSRRTDDFIRRMQIYGVVTDFEFELRRRDGSTAWVSVNARAVPDPETGGAGVEGTVADITARRAAERQLRESEERFRLVAQATSDAIWDWNLRTGAIWFSRSIERLGYDTDQAAQLGFLSANLHPDDRERVLASFRAAVEGDASLWAEEYRFRRADGTFAAVLNRGFIARNGAGRAVRMLGALTDISERREAEARYRSIFERAAEGTFRITWDGQFEAINPAGLAILGWASLEAAMAIVRPLPTLAADPLQRDALLERLRETGAVTDMEFRLRRRDGRVVWVSINARVVPNVTGEGTILEGTFSDISARKAAEAALERSTRQITAQKRELESILANLSDGLMLADDNRRLWLMNPAARAMFGLPAEGDPDALLRAASHWRMLDANGRTLEHDELPLARASRGEQISALELQAEIAGRRRILSTSAAPLRAPDGTHRGAVVVLRDITELRQEQENVAQSERLRALGEMASGVAHNFNNLLAVILGRCEILLGVVGATDAGPLTTPHAEVIKQAALDGAETVKRLQTFSGMNKARPAEAMDLAEVVRDVVEFTRPRWRDAAQQAGLTIQIDTQVAPLPALSSNPSDVREVLVNLLFNAVDAMPRGGTIRIGTRRRGGDVLLWVQDTGVGMEESVRRRVFEPFFTTKGARGHGLGLSMSYTIVERLGGRLSVQSAPDAGATFTIALPFRPYERQPAPAVGSVNRSLSLLLVDDETEILATTALLLELEGHRVTTASSGAEALRLLQARPGPGRLAFDAVLTDLGMPEMSGLQLVGAIRAAGRGLPCLLVTGWGAELTDDDVRAAGAQAVLPKPFAAADLRAALAEHVARSAC